MLRLKRRSGEKIIFELGGKKIGEMTVVKTTTGGFTNWEFQIESDHRLKFYREELYNKLWEEGDGDK